MTDTLKGKKIDLGLLLAPLKIFCYDSLLFVYHDLPDTLVSVYNLKDFTMIGKIFSRGEGPEELLSVSRIDFDDKGIMVIHDILGGVVKRFKIISKNNLLQTKVIGQTRVTSAAVDAFIISNKIICASREIDPLKRFYVYDTTGRRMSEMGDYPYYGRVIPATAAVEVFNAWAGVNSKRRGFVLAYEYTDLIEFYDENGFLLKRIHGPHVFYPEFELKIVGNYQFMRRRYNKTRYAWQGRPLTNNDSLCLLYAEGRTVSKDDLESDHFKCVVFMDWEGKPLAYYRLDYPIISLAVNWRQRKILGLNRHDSEVYEFSF